MNSFSLELLLLLFLILLNGLLSLSELALVSARKARLEQMANEGDKMAAVALQLASAPNNFLSTVQIGITFVGILSGAFGGATIADFLAQNLEDIPFLAPHGKTIGVVFVVVCITYFSLILGELVPKRLALNNPEKIARLVAPTLALLSRLAYPLVRLLGGSTNLLLRLFRFKPSCEPSVTEEEIILMINEGTRTGTFQAFEQDTIERVFRLADRRITVLMTPRIDMIRLNLDESLEETKDRILTHSHSSYPVVQGNLDNIVGVVRGKDLLAMIIEKGSFDLEALCRKPVFAAASSQVVTVLDIMKKSAAQMAFVVDEYGLVLGLVTYGDILRSVFENGEDTFSEKRDVVKREDGSWLIAGSMPLDEFFDFMEIKRQSKEEHFGMNTVGGFAMAKIGAIPKEGRHFLWQGLKFEIVDMDGRRVDKILVTRTT